MTQGGYQVLIILPIKSKIAAAKKQYFLRFLYLLSLHLRHSKSEVYSDYRFGISVNTYQ